MPSPRRTRDLLRTLLAFTSGCVDAVSYLGLGHVFTSNMTGNTVLLGLSIGQVKELAVAHSAVSLLAFVLGAGIGAVIVQGDRARTVAGGRY